MNLTNQLAASLKMESTELQAATEEAKKMINSSSATERYFGSAFIRILGHTEAEKYEDTKKIEQLNKQIEQLNKQHEYDSQLAMDLGKRINKLEEETEQLKKQLEYWRR